MMQTCRPGVGERTPECEGLRAAEDRRVWGYPESRAFAFAELLIDCEEDRIPRAVLVGMPLETG